MNWVGGIRSRVKVKQEKKLQKEFFERKRLQKKLNKNNPISVNASRTNNGSDQPISQDLLALQVIQQTHDKPCTHQIRQPTKIDLDHPNRHQPKFKNEEILDLPLPSSAKPSTLEFSEARDQPQVDKSSTYLFHKKEAFENITKKGDSHKPDFNTTASDSPFDQRSSGINQNRSVGSFYEKRTKYSAFSFNQKPTKSDKYSKFCESLESKRLSPAYSFHPKETENTKREASSYDYVQNTPTNFSFNEENVPLNEDRPQNIDSLYQIRSGPSEFVCDQDQTMKRKVDLFELNNFADVKRIRHEDLLVSKQSSIFTIHEKQQQRHTTPKYPHIEKKSPFIPYAAPAPYSLAARTITHQQDSYANSQKSGCYNHSTSQRLTQHSPGNNQYTNNENLEHVMETYQPISHNVEHEKLFLAGCIQSDKTSNDIRMSLIMENDDCPLPSPATNEITIECLNKSDPQSFLTDLHVLEEIIPENKHQPFKSNPDEIMKIESSSSQEIRQLNKNIIDDNTEINQARSEHWRNFITAAKRPRVDTPLAMDDKQDDQDEKNHSEGNVSTSENCSPRRTKNAAEELKEVMAVQQYESSQESSYYSSWSSSASEIEDNEKRVTSTKSEKLSSKEVKQTNPKERVQTTSLQDLPSTSTSEQLQNNSQNQVFTLGLSNGLKHLSKSKEQPVRNPDKKTSNLSVFRIYPLSRSEEKGTQTLKSNEATVMSVAVQCEIWSTNPLGNLTTRERKDIEASSSTDSELPDANTKPGCEEDVLESNHNTNTEIPSHNSESVVKNYKTNVDVQTSNSIPAIMDTPITNSLENTMTVGAEIIKNPERKTTNQLDQVVGNSAENILPDTTLILNENADTIIYQNNSRNTSANTTITDVQNSDPLTTKQNITETISYVPPSEITTEIAVSKDSVKTFSPRHKIMPNISNVDVQYSELVTL